MTALPRERASGPAVAASIAIHAALLAVVLAPVAHDAVAPASRTVEVRLLGAPLPAPAAAPAPSTPRRARPAPQRTANLAPAPVPPSALPAPAAPEDVPAAGPAATTPAPVATSVTTAPATAARASAADSFAATAPPQAAPAAPPSRSPPSLLDRTRPEYPWMSRRLRESGRVLLDILVGADGRAQAVSVAQTSGHPRLDDAATAAARGWRFEPAREGDRPVAARVRVPVVFDLGGGAVVMARVAAQA